MLCGIACVAANTKIETISGPKEISSLQQGDSVLSVQADGSLCFAKCNAPFVKGRAALVEVTHERGVFVAHENHLVLDVHGAWHHVRNLHDQMEIWAFAPTCSEDAANYQKTIRGLNDDCPRCNHCDDAQPRLVKGLCQDDCLRQNDEETHERHCESLKHNPTLLSQSHPSSYCLHSLASQDSLSFGEADPGKASEPYEPAEDLLPTVLKFQRQSECHRITPLSETNHASLVRRFCVPSKILSVKKTDEQEFWDVEIPTTGTYVAEGAVHHNTGKTYTGAHFVIQNMILHPDLTGCVAANTYDQLSQATIRELLYWLDEYDIPFVIDRQPPKEWGSKRSFKTYRNILSVKIGDKVVHAFTRVLSDGDALRGIEFSWYWLDETRDTPLNTHDIILSRCRESDYVKGLITTTTAGEDWCYERFVKKGNYKGGAFGSLHVRTYESVRYGIIKEDFYNTLRAAYSPMMAAQELDAQHVNVNSGRAYYAATTKNARRICPWGLEHPDPELPVIVGMDFNYAPAPMVWCVGQLSPDGDAIHWFEELSDVEISSREMARRLGGRYREAFLRIFGDASGGRATTSNEGKSDFDQIADELTQMGVSFSIDSDQANPRVKDRVEAVNAMLENGLGDIRMTYNPDRCPHLDADLRLVGWKPNGKLSDNGDHQRTHASDAAGYAVFKLFPPTIHAGRTLSNESPYRPNVV